MTSNKYLFDTSAWISYVLGEKSELKRIVDSKSTIITLSSSIGEIFDWCLRNKKDFQKFFSMIRIRSEILDVTTNNWIEAAHHKIRLRPTKKKIGLQDTLLLSVQEMFNLQIVTCDSDFSNLPNTIVL